MSCSCLLPLVSHPDFLPVDDFHLCIIVTCVALHSSSCCLPLSAVRLLSLIDQVSRVWSRRVHLCALVCEFLSHFQFRPSQSQDAVLKFEKKYHSSFHLLSVISAFVSCHRSRRDIICMGMLTHGDLTCQSNLVCMTFLSCFLTSPYIS